jgi:hypothetical protein
MTGYELSRKWFDFCFENPDKISTNHSALYFFIIEHCNRLGWKEKFGFPTVMAMEALGIKNWRTFKKAFDDLVEFGFIHVIEKSKNQYSANIIAIVKNTEATTKATTKALDKAIQKQDQKQSKSIVDINKPINKEPETDKPEKAKKEFLPPSLDEVIKYFDENNFSQIAARKAFEYYNIANWKDSTGKQVKNWKQKMISVWFKPENKKQLTTYNPNR